MAFQSTPGHKSREKQNTSPAGTRFTVSIHSRPQKPGEKRQRFSDGYEFCFNPLPATKAGRRPAGPTYQVPCKPVSIHSRPQKPGELQGLPIRCRANRFQSTPGHKSREKCTVSLYSLRTECFNPLPATKAGRIRISIVCHIRHGFQSTPGHKSRENAHVQGQLL